MTLLWSLDNRGPIMIKRRSTAPTWTILTLNCKDKFTYNYVLIKWLLWFTTSSKLISNHDRLFLLHYKMFAGVCQAGSGVCWSRGTFVGLDIFPELGYIFFSRWVQSWRLQTGLPLLLITVMLEQSSLRNDHSREYLYTTEKITPWPKFYGFDEYCRSRIWIHNENLAWILIPILVLSLIVWDNENTGINYITELGGESIVIFVCSGDVSINWSSH